MTLPVPVGLSILHKAPGQSYQRWCSIEGLREAAALGATAVDVDCHLSADGEWIATHWAKPLLHGFKVMPGGPSLRRDARISQLTVKQISYLRSTARDSRGYRISTVKELMKEAARLGITLCLEVKGDVGFTDPATYAPIRAYAAQVGCNVVIMTIHRYGGTPGKRRAWEHRAYARLAAAYKAQMPTLLLMRGPVAAYWSSVLWGAKGRKSWMRALTPRVRHLGPGSPSGMSVRPNRRAIARANVRMKRAQRQRGS